VRTYSLPLQYCASLFSSSVHPWEMEVGICPYCTKQLIENEGLAYRNYSKVRCHDKQIIDICSDCIRYMLIGHELVEIVVIENNADCSHEFVNASHTEEEKKKRRRFV
jgi:hypothetical protein